MSLTILSIILTIVELVLLLLHISVFACICKQIRRKIAPFTSSFFKIYSLRCLVDYAAYLMVGVIYDLAEFGKLLGDFTAFLGDKITPSDH